MSVAAAVRAAAPRAPQAAVEALDADALSELRLAHLAGQCAHESVGLTRTVESLYYTTPERLMAVWPSRFRARAPAMPFVRNPEALANHVYGGRMGNVEPGDGWRYRGRGYLQLTGRSNYRSAGLEEAPEKAEEPATAWRIAIDYLGRRKRGGLTAFEWADQNNVEMVTRIVNGGLHGLADRRSRTNAALAALRGSSVSDFPILRKRAEGVMVEWLQERLTLHGFPPGSIDGDFGPRTQQAVRAFQRARGLRDDAIVGDKTWRALLEEAGP